MKEKRQQEKAKEQFEDDQAGRRSRSQSNEEDSDAQFDGGSVETIRSKKQYDWSCEMIHRHVWKQALVKFRWNQA